MGPRRGHCGRLYDETGWRTRAAKGLLKNQDRSLPGPRSLRGYLQAGTCRYGVPQYYLTSCHLRGGCSLLAGSNRSKAPGVPKWGREKGSIRRPRRISYTPTRHRNTETLPTYLPRLAKHLLTCLVYKVAASYQARHLIQGLLPDCFQAARRSAPPPFGLAAGASNTFPTTGVVPFPCCRRWKTCSFVLQCFHRLWPATTPVQYRLAWTTWRHWLRCRVGPPPGRISWKYGR